LRTKIPSLYGLRAVSILLVILAHVRHNNFGGFKVSFPVEILFDGALGVNVFFVISGFLITKLLLDEESSNGSVSIKNFITRRVFRIFPAYYFLLFIYFLLQLLHVLYFTPGSWASSLFYYKYIGESDWESGHFWSLSVEEHFYLIWPLVFAFAPRLRPVFAWFLVVMVMVFRINAYYHWLDYKVFVMQESFFLRCDALMIGCLGALYYQNLTDWIKKHYRISTVGMLAAGLMIALSNSSILMDLNRAANLHLGVLLIPLGIGSSTGVLTNFSILLLIIASINLQGNLWFRILNSSPLEFIGKLSYSIYLWQQIFFSKKLGFLSSFPLNILCIAVVSYFSYRYVETYFLKLRDSKKSMGFS